VVGEVRAASLVLDSSHYQNKCWQHAAAFVCSPALTADMADLQAALADGRLNAVGSQNCVYASKHVSFDPSKYNVRKYHDEKTRN
jgi:hypothetical protein